MKRGGWMEGRKQREGKNINYAKNEDEKKRKSEAREGNKGRLEEA